MASIFSRLRGLFPGPTKKDVGPDTMYSDPAYELLRRELDIQGDRYRRYSDYDEMDFDVVIEAALDIYADEACQHDREQGATLWAESKDKKTEAVIEDLFDRIKVEDYIWGIARDLAKYGDEFQKLELSLRKPEEGIQTVTFQQAKDIERVEYKSGRLRGFRFTKQEGLGNIDASRAKMSNPWDYIHWRIIGKKTAKQYGGGKYGTSVIDASRKVWRKLNILEDALMIFRLTRAPLRLLFKIDVRNASEYEALQTARDYKRAYSLKSSINPESGQYISKHHALAFDNNIYFPVRKDSASDVVPFPGGADVSGIADIEYFRDQLYGSLKIPKCLMTGTKIRLLTGEDVEIQDLVGRDEFWVYSCLSDGTLVPGRGHNARRTKIAARVVEVNLDNGCVERCTPEHLWMMRDGTYREAQHLRAGDSLMPLYRKIVRRGKSKTPYEMVAVPRTGRWQMTHSMVDGWLNGVLPKNVVRHHCDFNSLNNDPDNLLRMTEEDHMRLHTTQDRSALLEYLKSPAHAALSSQRMKERWQDPKWRAVFLAAADRGRRAPRSREWIEKHPMLNQRGEQHYKYRHDVTFAQVQEASCRNTTLTDALREIGIERTVAKRLVEAEGIPWRVFLSEHGFSGGKTPQDEVGTKDARRLTDWTLDQILALVPECGTLNELIERSGIRSRLQFKKFIEDSGIEWEAFLSWCGYRTRNANGHNHKVVAVRVVEELVDCYDITVDEFSNFALSSGVFVHNSYLGHEEGVNAKATLSQLDVRFARTIKRLQRSIINGYTQMAQIELALRDMDPDPANFQINMAVVSMLEETQKLEAMQLSITIADQLKMFLQSLGFDLSQAVPFILRYYLNLHDNEIEAMGLDYVPKVPLPLEMQPGMGPGGPGAKVKEAIKDLLRKDPELAQRVRMITELTSTDDVGLDCVPDATTRARVLNALDGDDPFKLQ